MTTNTSAIFSRQIARLPKSRIMDEKECVMEAMSQDDPEQHISDVSSNASSSSETTVQGNDDHAVGPSWRGTPLYELPQIFFLPPIKVDDKKEHVVMVEFPMVEEEPQPWPKHALPDRWDDCHVRMPHSPQSLFPFHQQVTPRWPLVQEALCGEIKDFDQLRRAILYYNRLNNAAFQELRRNLQLLHEDCHDEESSESANIFYDKLLPSIKQLCLMLPDQIKQPLPLLRRGCNKAITMSQKQIACLMANAFFCTFPRRNVGRSRRHEYSNFPSINFTSLFSGLESDGRGYEKLRCLLQYFHRISDSNGQHNGLVTFERRSLEDKNLPSWRLSRKPLTRLHVDSKGTIEDDGSNMLQVDFANAYIGGGVLGHGCVQEEIRFLISPELIVSRLFTERLDDNECLFITGFERFSNYTGYARSFRWESSHVDKTPFDSSTNRRKVRLVAMDALYVSNNRRRQYRSDHIVRELNKAYIAFLPHSHETTTTEGKAVPVATGNWGCGAFGGDPRLKCLLQIMAASQAGRDVVYYTFGDKQLCRSMSEMHTFLVEKEVCVSDLFEAISGFQQLLNSTKKSLEEFDLFDFLYKEIEKFNADTDDEVMDEGHNKAKMASTDCGKLESVFKSEDDDLLLKVDERALGMEGQAESCEQMESNFEDIGDHHSIQETEIINEDSPHVKRKSEESFGDHSLQESGHSKEINPTSEEALGNSVSIAFQGNSSQPNEKSSEKAKSGLEKMEQASRSNKEREKVMSGFEQVEQAQKRNVEAFSSSSVINYPKEFSAKKQTSMMQYLKRD